MLAPEFENFLFASIGEDVNGMQVSVLSGLAQSDLDPWQEAAKLARLPGKTAIERLASLIEALPARAWTHPDARAIATRLIALLPHPLADNAASSQAPHNLGAMMSSRPWWIYVILMSFVLGSQFIVANHELPPTADRSIASSVGGAIPPHPPVNSVQ
ncbi:hypothetical protein [Bradyrhizobium canariense]|nr:hypothetical protein [Bradyrhizobium canariense]